MHTPLKLAIFRSVAETGQLDYIKELKELAVGFEMADLSVESIREFLAEYEKKIN